ncbi:UNVERIFIED_CONTAM: Mitochondrial ornithine transporter 1, partial [Eudyptes robustus]
KESSYFKDGAIDLLAGTAGGIANVYFGQPLDTVKVKMQSYPELYKSWMTCFAQTFRAEGIRGLYAGTIPALAANIAENAVLFTAYGFCQKSIAFMAGRKSTDEMTSVEKAASGSFAAVFAALVLCPTELVKCRLQAHREVHPDSSATPLSVCREMYKAQGVRAFATGMTPTLAREVPGYFFFFGAYETTRKYMSENGKKEIGVGGTAVSGAIGGMALWTAIFPADVVKSKMQVTGKGNFVSTFMDVLRTQGPLGLYAGLTPTLLRTFTASSGLFIAYEYTKKFL